jgi:hypothetical protein
MTFTIKIQATAIKAVLLLLSLNLALSCSNDKPNTPTTGATAQNAAPSEKSPESMTINGTVKAITFGKDGYTADVQTEKDGNYAALVSIVNVGGRENYKPCGMGDNVTFKGVPSVLGGVKQLMVKEIITVISTQNPALEAKYKGIKPNEYCWQTNKVLELHVQPSADSKVEGKHFAGETLKVLGTKMINNQLWVNVTYTLKVKAGYEDQFADGQVMSSGSPIGWIGGAETPKINCK